MCFVLHAFGNHLEVQAFGHANDCGRNRSIVSTHGDVAHERLFRGDALVVFVEGTRSRTRGMQQTLTAVTRYFDFPDVWVLPAGITGTEEMFPIGEDGLHPVRAITTIGPPIEGRELHEQAKGDRRMMMDAVGSKIARLLPLEYRGAYS